MDINDDEGIIDIDDINNMKFDILDYDLDCSSNEQIIKGGNDDDDELIDIDIDEITTNKLNYHTLRFGVDLCWLIYSGYNTYRGFIIFIENGNMVKNNVVGLIYYVLVMRGRCPFMDI